ncbi:MAG TPA: I78 family peptidase inhibitor [Croceibacterium sp.]|nr:I78 family peptidase inhibitor [Croceibacterium sp.]
MRATVLVIACALLSACAVTPPPRDEPPPRHAGECSADAAQHLVGSKATGETGAELMRLTHATTLRWVPPRTAVTMDFRADRLTVSYDDDMVITRISCT